MAQYKAGTTPPQRLRRGAKPSARLRDAVASKASPKKSKKGRAARTGVGASSSRAPANEAQALFNDAPVQRVPVHQGAGRRSRSTDRGPPLKRQALSPANFARSGQRIEFWGPATQDSWEEGVICSTHALGTSEEYAVVAMGDGMRVNVASA